MTTTLLRLDRKVQESWPGSVPGDGPLSVRARRR